MEYWIWLQAVLGSTSRALPELMNKYSSPQRIYNLGTKCIGLSPACKKRINKISLDDCKLTAAKCEKLGITVIAYDSPQYPKALKNIADPPAVLYVKGKLPDFDHTPAFCIVGPRKCSDLGKKAAFSLGYRLAKGGMTVVSGGAVGADFYAHAGAVKAGGKTVAVMPCGVNVNYPAVNKKLRDTILSSNGCLVSEYPPDTLVNKGAFSVRNRLLSGLSLGIAVVEAGEKSGALITANHALEQGKDIFVMPGRTANSANYAGSKQLLEDGAIPLLSAVKIFELYYPAFPDKIRMREAYDIKKDDMRADYTGAYEELFVKEKNISVKKTPSVKEHSPAADKVPAFSREVLSPSAGKVLDAFSQKEMTVDDLYLPEISDSQIFAALSELELYGFITALPGGRFEKI